VTSRIDEVSDGVFRISIPVPPSVVPGGFTFNQYLIVDEAPLLFHTGSRMIFPAVAEAIARVMPVNKLRYIGFSHYEQDECGGLNEFLAVAPNAVPLCGQINAMINAAGMDRPPHVLADNEKLSLGRHQVRWLDAPHLPHAWECGYLLEEATETLLCGDLFTQGGSDVPPLTESEILGPSEKFRKRMDYFSHTKNARGLLKRLAQTRPKTLACMHGSAWSGDGEKMLMALAESLETTE
jgi:flavorubredoxin